MMGPSLTPSHTTMPAHMMPAHPLAAARGLIPSEALKLAPRLPRGSRQEIRSLIMMKPTPPSAPPPDASRPVTRPQGRNSVEAPQAAVPRPPATAPDDTIPKGIRMRLEHISSTTSVTTSIFRQQVPQSDTPIGSPSWTPRSELHSSGIPWRERGSTVFAPMASNLPMSPSSTDTSASGQHAVPSLSGWTAMMSTGMDQSMSRRRSVQPVGCFPPLSLASSGVGTRADECLRNSMNSLMAELDEGSKSYSLSATSVSGVPAVRGLFKPSMIGKKTILRRTKSSSRNSASGGNSKNSKEDTRGDSASRSNGRNAYAGLLGLEILLGEFGESVSGRRSSVSGRRGSVSGRRGSVSAGSRGRRASVPSAFSNSRLCDIASIGSFGFGSFLKKRPGSRSPQNAFNIAEMEETILSSHSGIHAGSKRHEWLGDSFLDWTEENGISGGKSDYRIVEVPLKLLYFYQSAIRNSFSDGKSFQTTVDALRNGELTPYQMPLAHVNLTAGRLYCMGTRRLACLVLAFWHTNPDKLIPVLWSGKAMWTGFPQGDDVTLTVSGGGVLIDGAHWTSIRRGAPEQDVCVKSLARAYKAAQAPVSVHTNVGICSVNTDFYHPDHVPEPKPPSSTYTASTKSPTKSPLAAALLARQSPGEPSRPPSPFFYPEQDAKPNNQPKGKMDATPPPTPPATKTARRSLKPIPVPEPGEMMWEF
eukprot:Hpha_TRINITY_DN16356_c1_g9::TRINITY_DN16356_c1_g9_i1::g.58677::m.58677